MTAAEPPVSGRRLTGLGIWLGLVYGLLEAAQVGLLSLVPGALSWRSANGAPIVFVAPLVYGAVFGVVAALLSVLARPAPRVRWDAVLVVVTVAIGAYCFATLQGQLFSDLSSTILAVGIGTAAARGYGRWHGPIERFRRRSTPWLIGGIAAAAVVVLLTPRIIERRRMAQLPPAPAGAPNVLMLVLDTQRGDHLSSYGHHLATSPVLDSLGARGALFLQPFAPSSWTLPSHATFMTGRHQSEHRAGIRRRPYLDDRFPTVAEELARRGWATGGFVSNTFWAGSHTGVARGFQRYHDLYMNAADAVARTSLGRSFGYRIGPRFGLTDIPGRRSAAEINEDFLSWLDGIGERPFYAFLNYLDVHSPFRAPAPFDGTFSGVRRSWESASGVDIGALGVEDEPRSPDVIRRALLRYDESLRYLDAQIGALLDELRRRNRYRNTLIIVTSDHGESFGEHDVLNHGHSLWRDQIHVPLLIEWPGHLAPLREPRPVGLDRIPATIAAATGLDSATFPGRSLLDTAANNTPVLSELARRFPEPGKWPSSWASWTSIVDGTWHLLVPDSGTTELYNYLADPDETRNLAADSAHQAVRRQMEQHASRLRSRW